MVKSIQFNFFRIHIYILIGTIVLLMNSCKPAANLQLSVDNQQQTLSQELVMKIKKLIQDTYPKLLKQYNPNATKTIEVVVDTDYKGVAYASGTKIVVNPEWLEKNPEDYDLFTHEIMHLIQAYPNNSGPSWLTEGIADYVRAKYGINNQAANWSLLDYNSSQSYTNSYRVSARFLVWIEKNHDRNFVKKIDKHLREGTYSADLWQKYAGVSLDELWEDYAANPEI